MREVLDIKKKVGGPEPKTKLYLVRSSCSETLDSVKSVLYCRHSQVHSDPEWQYLFGSHL